VLPAGTSLEVRPLTSGVETTYVVPSAGGASGLREQLRVPAGFSVRQGTDFIEVVDSSGKLVANWGGGLATDSSSRRADTGVSLQLGRYRARLVVGRLHCRERMEGGRHSPGTRLPKILMSSRRRVGGCSALLSWWILARGHTKGFIES
jgi:hypothetical protein